MTKGALAAADARPAPVVRGEAEWRALMADYENWDGTQVAFCRARGIWRKTFQALAALLFHEVPVLRDECRDLGLHRGPKEFLGTGLDDLGEGVRRKIRWLLELNHIRCGHVAYPFLFEN